MSMKKTFKITILCMFCAVLMFVGGCRSQEETSSQEGALPRVDPLDSTKAVQTELSKQAQQALSNLSGDPHGAIPLDQEIAPSDQETNFLGQPILGE
ncbi:MAG: hypothetical protein AB7G75_27305 [Candidatus Binatia bacterium]